MGPVILDLVGYELTEEELDILRHPLVGGVIFFSRNFYDKEQLSELVNTIRQKAQKPILLMVDQEGGRVQRFKEGFTLIPPAQAYAELVEPAQQQAIVAAAGWIMAAELLSVGIDLSLAPVLDLGHQCPAIGSRAFHSNVEQVITLASAFISGMKEAGMAATGKHFPGHGAVMLDSHLTTPVDARALTELMSQDIFVFHRLIQQHLLDAIIPAHVVYPQCDPLPASASPYWLKQILRQQMNFNGLVFSDDLNMEGAAILGSYSERACSALHAGCDMILMCNNRAGIIEIIQNLSPITVDESRFLPLIKRKILDGNTLLNSKKWQQTHEKVLALTELWQ